MAQAAWADQRACVVLRAQRRGPGDADLPRAPDAGGGGERHAPDIPPDALEPNGVSARAAGADRPGRRLRVCAVVLRLQASPGAGAIAASAVDGGRTPSNLTQRGTSSPFRRSSRASPRAPPCLPLGRIA